MEEGEGRTSWRDGWPEGVTCGEEGSASDKSEPNWQRTNQAMLKIQYDKDVNGPLVISLIQSLQPNCMQA